MYMCPLSTNIQTSTAATTSPYALPSYGYAKLSKKVDAGYITVYTGESLKFHFLQEYGLASGDHHEPLMYRIFNFKRIVVLGTEENGQHQISGSPELLVEYGDNYIDLSFQETQLGYGNFLLEVITSKGEKLFLKFKRVETTPT